MADRKITDLTALAAGSQATGDLLTIVDVSEAAATDKNKKITVESLFKGIPSNVGIGVSSPGAKLELRDNTQALLSWGDTAAIGSLSFDGSSQPVVRALTGKSLVFQTNGGNERMRIDSSGRLLVGHSSSVGDDNNLQVVGSTADASSATFWRSSSDAGNPSINFVKTRGSVASPSIVSSGDILGHIRFNGYDGTDHNSRAAEIKSEVDGTPGSNDMPGRLVFSTTADGASSPTERMRIDSSGNVGIGTSPARNLHVHGSDSDTVQIHLTNSTTGATSNDGFSIVLGSDESAILNMRENNPMRFFTNDSERMRIDTSGRLLVGTTSDTTGDTGAKVQIVDTGTPVLALSRNDTSIVSGNTIGQIRIFSNDDSGYQECARIAAQADGTFANNDKPTRLVFSTTADGASSPTERMRINSSGQVMIGTTSSIVGSLQVKAGGDTITTQTTGSVGATNATAIGFKNNAGTYSGAIYVNGSSTTYSTSSDYRLKENVINITGGIARVKQLQPKRFNFISDDSRTVDGFLAHEAQAVVPEAVTGTHNEVDEDNNPVYQGIDQSKLVPLLTAALQEAIAEIETLKTKVAALEAG